MEAKRNRNAKIISVDPRFTRTSSVADLFCQIRAGTDIAFLGGVINYAIQNNRIAKEYLVNYTNAGFVVHNDFTMPTEADGVFSGFDAGETDLRPGDVELYWQNQSYGVGLRSKSRHVHRVNPPYPLHFHRCRQTWTTTFPCKIRAASTR